MPVTRRQFVTSAAAAGATLSGFWSGRGLKAQSSSASVQLIRNATMRVRYGGRTLLFDPYLSDRGSMPAFNNTPNPRLNPLVPLPIAASQVVADVHATVLTHTHVDHWDTVARDRLPKSGPVFVQRADTDRLSQAGFTDVRPLTAPVEWEGITITPTRAQHGRGEMATRMGPVSGYVLSRPGLPTVYVAGDSVWFDGVAEAIRDHTPDVIVVNAGEAQFLEGGPIIMGVDDVVNVSKAAPRATIVAVHMEAVNHCVLTRDGLRQGLARAGITSTVRIPMDGEEVRI